MLARLWPDWLSFRRFAAFTTGLTLTLMMLGVYTSATGSGLACSAQWPLCDNGLLPQTLPSFVEWFHRLVAMVTGFFILGTAAWAWRRDDRRVRLAATGALVLLPIQVSLGAVTVTLSGMIPGGYAPSTQGAHLGTALSIFALLTLTALWAGEDPDDRPPRERARAALLASLGVLAVSGLLSRVTTLVPYSPAGQAAFTGVTLAAIAALLAVVVWLARVDEPLARTLAGGGLVVAVVVLVLGRDLVFYSQTVRLLNLAAFVLGGVLVAGATLTLSRETEHEARPGTTTGP